jgi:RNA polymerase sigma-70 factor (ECF subfamily)
MVELLPRMRRFAYALTSDPNKADDLVQEGYARAFAHQDGFQPGTRLASWMYQIIHNVWLNQLRASRLRGPILDIEALPEPAGQDGRDLMESRLTLRRVLRALSQLPQEQREVVALVSIEGLSYQEAADILGVPLGTVTSRLARGRRTLYEIAIEGVARLRGSA